MAQQQKVRSGAAPFPCVFGVRRLVRVLCMITILHQQEEGGIKQFYFLERISNIFFQQYCERKKSLGSLDD